MNDIKRLNEVIESLEQQSSKVSKFNGVLEAVNAAKEDISSAKETLSNLANEQQTLVTESYKRFEEYGKRLTELESKLAALEGNQEETLRNLSDLSFVTPNQFEAGLDKILLRQSELKFLTPAQYEEGRNESEKAIINGVTQQSDRITVALSNQESAIKSLRMIVFWGMFLIAGGIAFFLVKDFFM